MRQKRPTVPNSIDIWVRSIINIVFSAVDFSREEFAQTVSVRGTIRGRAPVVVDEHHIICVDTKGMDVSIYEYDNAKFPLKGSLQVIFLLSRMLFAIV